MRVTLIDELAHLLDELDLSSFFSHIDVVPANERFTDHGHMCGTVCWFHRSRRLDGFPSKVRGRAQEYLLCGRRTLRFVREESPTGIGQFDKTLFLTHENILETVQRLNGALAKIILD